MAHILIASHHPCLTTSYARVHREFATALRTAGHRVSGIGAAAPGEAGPTDYPVDVTLPDELPAAVGRAVERQQPDLLVTIGDPWMFEDFGTYGRRPGCRWLTCFPLDGGPVPRQWVPWMAAADSLVVFSRFAAGLVSAAVGREPHVLYHGVDTAVFCPRDKSEAKRRVVGDDAAFVVGCVATNQQRKNLPALLRSFAAFAADKPDTLLYLHAPVAGHWDMEELADRYGITARTRATLNYSPRRGLPDDLLAVVYNSFDVLALPSMGEGFGLPLLEAQACGVPALATDCSAGPELLTDPAQRVRVAATLVMARNVEQAVIDESDLAAKLDALYRDAALRVRLSAAGLALARSLDWAGIRRQLVDVVRQVLV